METFLSAAFWLSTIWIMYVYFGYPLVLSLWALRGTRPAEPFSDPETVGMEWPSVTLLIAAYNESAIILSTLQNKSELDYPPDRLQVWIVSDASDDGTDERVKGFIEQFNRSQPESAGSERQFSFRLVRQPLRSGKTAALNAVLADVHSDLIVMCDANSFYEPQGLRHLVTPFHDPDVGYVTGRQVLIDPEGHLIGDGSSALMRYENWLRDLENRCGGIVGVDGGMDAIRTSLYEPLRPDQLPDFVQPLKVAEKGFRVLFEPSAVVKEVPNHRPEDEWRMRVRVATRAFHALSDMKHLLNPFRQGGLALRLWSHKLLRYLAFVPLASLVVASSGLASVSPIYAFALMGQLGFYALAFAIWRNPDWASQFRLGGIVFYFTLLNLAFAKGFWCFMRGERTATWEPRKG